MQEEDEAIPFTLDIVVPVYSGASSISSFCGALSLRGNDAAKDQATLNNFFCRLPKYLDPNLDVLEKLPSIDISFEPDMNQSWNTAPYFLDIPSSPLDSRNDEDSILIFGGLDIRKNVSDWLEASILGCSIFQYFFDSGTFHYWGSMLEPKCYHAICLVGLYAYISGGYSLVKCQNGEMKPASSSDRLNLKTKEWKRCSNMNIARAAHAMVVFENCLYVFGGRGLDGKAVSIVEVYDPREDIWLKICELPIPAMGLSAISFSDVIWIIGGITTNDMKNKKDCVLSHVYQFSPFTKSWSVMKPLPEPRGYAVCTCTFDGIWVFGGCNLLKEDDYTMSSCSSVFYFPLHHKLSNWQTMTSLSYARHAFSAALSGRNVYIFGGIESSKSSASDKVEIYDLKQFYSKEYAVLPACIGGSNCVYLNPQHLTVTRSSLLYNSKYRKKDTSKHWINDKTVYHFLKSPSEFITAPCILHSIDVHSNSGDSLIENINKIDVTKSESTNDQNQTATSNINSKVTKSYSLSFDAEKDKKSNSSERLFDKSRSEKKAVTLDLEQKNSLALTSKPLMCSLDQMKKGNSCKRFVTALEQTIPKNLCILDKVNLSENEKQYKTSLDIILNDGYLKKTKHKTAFATKPKASQKCKPSLNLSVNSKGYTSSGIEFLPTSYPFTTYTSPPRKEQERHESFFACEKNDICENKADNSVHSSYMYVHSDMSERMQMPMTSIDAVDSHDCVRFVSFHPHFESTYRKDSKIQKKYYQEPFFKPLPVKSSSDSQVIKNREMYEAMLCRKHAYSEKVDVPEKQKECTFALSLPTVSSKTILSSPVILVLGGESRNNSSDNFLGNEILLFKPQENAWECAGFLAKPRCHHTATFLDNTLYIIGGFRNANSLWIEDICAEVLSFNHINRKWKMKPSMNHDRAFHATVVLDCKIFVIGGRNSFGDILSSVEVFVEEDNSWCECQSLPYPILSASVTVIGNFIYVFGGITIEENSEIISTRTLVFDSKINSWFFGAELSIPCACSGASNFLNHAFLFGGLKEGRDNVQSIQEIFQLDIFSQTWSEFGNLSVPRHSPVIALIDSSIYIIGGFSTQEDSSVCICEVMNVSDRTVTRIAPLPRPISGMAGVILPATNHNK